MIGRLTPLESGTVGQEFPEDWKREIFLLDVVGATCAEWLVTTASPNPLHDDDLSNEPVTAVNIHYLTEENLSVDKMEAICKSTIKQKIFNLTLPLMGATSLRDLTKRMEIVDKLIKIVKKYPEIDFSLETELPAVEMAPILSLASNLYVTYDTGNITSYGYNHKEEILSYGSKINNVHLKDRLINGPSVLPFTGDTNFRKIFESLKKINYKGPYILELARPRKGTEVDYVTRYIKKFKCLI
jgi:hexulose-6-phosphate isomerase